MKSCPIYVLPWGTSYPVESFDSIKAELESVGGSDIRCFCDEEFSDDDYYSLLNAGGIYFPGGNQNKVMDRIFKYRLKSIIQNLYFAGVPIAGTAIQSGPMLTGYGSETNEGLNLLSGYIVDQHFIVCKREARLIGALVNNSGYGGLGIDEDMSAVLEDGRYLTAIGPSLVLLYLLNNESYDKHVLSHGQSVEFP